MGLNGVKCLCFGSALWILVAFGSDEQVARETMTLSEEQNEFLVVSPEQAEAIAEARAEQKAQDLDADEKRALDLALEALGREVNLTKLELTRQRVYAVEWPDSSLGCPQQGRSYLQVITPGYLVSLTANLNKARKATAATTDQGRDCSIATKSCNREGQELRNSARIDGLADQR